MYRTQAQVKERSLLNGYSGDLTSCHKPHQSLPGGRVLNPIPKP